MASITAAEAQTEAAYTGAIGRWPRRWTPAIRTWPAIPNASAWCQSHRTRAQALGEALEILRLGALLHDIGKIGVPDEVLRKPGV